MSRSIITVILLSILTCFSQCEPNQQKEPANATTATLPLPEGWLKRETTPGLYEIGLDAHAGKDGSNAATIRSLKDTIGFGNLMQVMNADSFKGKKLKFSGYMKTVNVKEGAAFWMRVDLKNGTMGEFDNMYNRSVTGTTDWQKFDIVLKVDTTAVEIAYGAMLRGSGQIWFDQLKFEKVPDSTSSTNIMNTSVPKAANLDFEK